MCLSVSAVEIKETGVSLGQCILADGHLNTPTGRVAKSV